jgi:3-isopropylmalate dehydrogenase
MNIIDRYSDCDFAGFYHVTSPFDVLLVREMTGGIYHGERGRLYAPCGECMGRGCQEAYDTEKYSWVQIERILRVAYECADIRRKKLCVVDKADVLESSRMWREVVSEISVHFPQIETELLNIEKAVAKIINTPDQFDVIVTSNMFGEIIGGALSALATEAASDGIQYSLNIINEKKQ